MSAIVINVAALYSGRAKLAELDDYEKAAIHQAGEGNEVVLTGEGPIWLYLRLGHRLHGHAKRLSYRAPALTEGDVVIFSHDPY